GGHHLPEPGPPTVPARGPQAGHLHQAPGSVAHPGAGPDERAGRPSTGLPATEPPAERVLLRRGVAPPGPTRRGRAQPWDVAIASMSFFMDAAMGLPFTIRIRNTRNRPFMLLGVRSHTTCTWLPPPGPGVTSAETKLPGAQKLLSMTVHVT